MRAACVLVVALLFAASATAESIYCDPQSGDKYPPTHYLVVFEDGTTKMTPYSEPDPSKALVTDSVPPEGQVVIIYAIQLNEEGERVGQSGPVPFASLLKPRKLKIGAN